VGRCKHRPNFSVFFWNILYLIGIYCIISLSLSKGGEFCEGNNLTVSIMDYLLNFKAFYIVHKCKKIPERPSGIFFVKFNLTILTLVT